jgi:lambda repressor-like predicted transcriptional regulator
MSTLKSIASKFPVNLMAENVRIFWQVKSAYDQCDSEIRASIDDMFAICNESDATEDDKSRAMDTIIEALFPGVAVDILAGEQAARRSPQAMRVERELDDSEALFAANVQAAMIERGITQEELARAAGVTQPAISNMLNRRCRPQSRTIAKIAEALGKQPADLWPVE